MEEIPKDITKPIQNFSLPTETRFDKNLSQEDFKLLQYQWDIFNTIKNETITENPLQTRIENRQPEFLQGSLIHGTIYNPEKIKKIKELGIVSGELVGVMEDAETHYCADFFRVPQDFTVSEYLEWCGQPATPGPIKIRKGEFNYLPMPNRKNKAIAFIVDTTNSKIQPLLKYDAYDPKSSERMKSIINKLPRETDASESRTISAVLVGIPANFISGILVGNGITKEEIDEIKKIMGGNIPILATDGKEI